MKIVVIDGQGGKIGKLVIEELKKQHPEQKLTALGTNSIAVSTMLKAGAEYEASGENPVIVASRDADIIIGPLGIIIADSLLGEITSAMSVAIGSSKAYKILIPINKCNHYVVGISDCPLSEYVSIAVNHVSKILKNKYTALT